MSIPAFIPDRIVLRLHRWGLPEKKLAAAIDDVYGALDKIWNLAPRFPQLMPFFESRVLVEHGAATALLSRVLAADDSIENVDLRHFLELSFLHDVGMAFLPEDLHWVPPKSLPTDYAPVFESRGFLGREMVSGLEDEYPGLGILVLRHPNWQTMDIKTDPVVVLSGLAGMVDDVLRYSEGRSDGEVVSGLAHEAPPQHFVRLQRTFKVHLPGLFSQAGNP